jgi:HSP20 family molecular chaperone IbpA
MTIGAVPEGGQASTTPETVVEDEDVTNRETFTTIVQPPPPTQRKYWLSERSVGEFTRCFIFHVRVDQDHVQASIKNGLLSVVVPKAQEQDSRKIPIS